MTRTRLAAVGSTLAGVLLLTPLIEGQAPAAQPPYLAPAGQTASRFTTLPGFVVERVVPGDRTDSYIVITFDSLGRPVVSKEHEAPRVLIDADRDGVYEGERIITDRVRNCQGLWFDGRTLYGNCAPGDAAAAAPAGSEGAGGSRSGLFRIREADGDALATDVELLAEYRGGIQEHGPHAIRRGPDGAPVVMVGNNSFVPDDRLAADAPLRDQREAQFLPALPDGRGFGPSAREGLHGVLFRYDVAANTFTPIFGGLRNAYDVAFNLAGEAFTFDSDMEWDLNLPWYREVRTVHGVPGGNYGYRNGSGKLPEFFIDSLPPVRDLRRGSPVGVEVYQHHAYPEAFADSLLEADWSRGRLLWTPLIRDGASYRAREADTELVHGEPLNITDVEVGPDGLVYFTTGGRQTEGGLFRVRYTGGAAAPEAPPAGILAVIRQPQPLSSWGWAAIEQARASMGEAFARELARVAGDTAEAGADRAQALYLLQRHGGEPGLDLLQALALDGDTAVRAAAAYVAGLQGPAAIEVVRAGLRDGDPLVRRRAAEALIRMTVASGVPTLASVDEIHPLLQSADRFVRWAGRLVLERMPVDGWRERVMADASPFAGIEGLVALVDASPADAAAVAERALALLRKGGISRSNQVRLVRAFQLAAMRLPGPPARLREDVFKVLAPLFPTGDRALDRELASTLAWTRQPGAIAEILDAMPEGREDEALQIHDVYALRVIDAGWTPEQRARLTDWFIGAITWRGGASFPGYLNLIFDEVVNAAAISDAEQAAALERLPPFAPLDAADAAVSRGARSGVPAAVRARGARTISRQELFDELVYTPQRTRPSADTGEQVFVERCAACHRYGELGRDLGPDLTTVGSRFRRKDILEAILFPSRVVSDQYASTALELADGEALGGMVVSEDAETIVLRTAGVPDRPVAVAKARVAKRTTSSVSLMPEDLVDTLTTQQLANLLAFLQGEAPLRR
jgi:putative heme-binding domain-containing protein